MKRVLYSLTMISFILLFAPKTSSACTNGISPDTNIVKYDLNDPRNPDCPCHAAQKLADEEYQRSLAKNDINPSNNNPVENDEQKIDNANVNSTSTTTSGGGNSKHYSRTASQLKRISKWSKRIKRKIGKRHNGTKKGNHRLANCFHF
ncbi:hypothetical protein BH09BAC5_BH09BAC5_02200 [soil metagenome]